MKAVRFILMMLFLVVIGATLWFGDWIDDASAAPMAKKKTPTPDPYPEIPIVEPEAYPGPPGGGSSWDYDPPPPVGFPQCSWDVNRVWLSAGQQVTQAYYYTGWAELCNTAPYPYSSCVSYRMDYETTTYTDSLWLSTMVWPDSPPGFGDNYQKYVNDVYVQYNGNVISCGNLPIYYELHGGWLMLIMSWFGW